MATGKRRIKLLEGRQGLWSRWLGRRSRPALAAVQDSGTPGVDYTLQHRASIRAVRSFIEAIETYQLHTRRIVHVVSRYVLPSDRGLQDCVPEWLAERVRFGVVQGAGDFGYLQIQAVDVAWDPEGTELFLHLDRRVTPGTRAFIAAYLGEGDGLEEMQDLSSALLLGGPG